MEAKEKMKRASFLLTHHFLHKFKESFKVQKFTSHLLYGNDKMGVNYFFAFHQFLPNLKRQKKVFSMMTKQPTNDHHGSCSGTIQMFKRGGSRELVKAEIRCG